MISGAAAVFAVAVLGHSSSLKNDYVIDDFTVVVNNEFAREWDSFKLLARFDNVFTPILPVRCGARPLTLLSWLIDASVYKDVLRGYHLTNVLLHGVNSVLVFWLAVLLFSKVFDAGTAISPGTSIHRAGIYPYAVLAGVIFAVHPLQAEAVNVVSFRGDMLACLFYVLSLIILLKAVDGPKVFYAVLPFTFIFGLLAKEIAISLPFACLLLVMFFEKKKTVRTSMAALTLMLTAAAAFFAVFWWNKFDYRIFHVVFTSIRGNISPLSSAAAYSNTVYATLLHYLRVFAWPFGLSVEYQLALPGTVLNVRAVLSAALAAWAVYCFIMTGNGVLKAGLGLLFVAYLPVSNIVPLPNVVADRYMYLPMIGFSVIVAAVLWKADMTGALKTGAGLLICLMLTAGTLVRNADFRDMYSVYSGAVKAAPENARARYNLALALMDKNDYSGAMQQFNKAVGLNQFYKKDGALPQMGICLEKAGNIPEAKKLFLESIRIDPNQTAYDELAGIAWKEKDYERTKEYLLNSLNIAPDPVAYNDMGAYYTIKKDYKKAAQYYRQAIGIMPHYTDAWYNLIALYKRSGSKAEAERTINDMAAVYAKEKWSIARPQAEQN